MSEQKTSVLMLFQSKLNMRYRMFIAVSLILLQQFTGQPNVLYYASTIFEQVGFSSDTGATRTTLLLGVTKVCAATIALLFLDKSGRRTFLLVGALGMMIAIGTMGIALADISIQEPVEKLCDSVTANMTASNGSRSTDQSMLAVPDTAKYTPLIAILLFVLFYGLGFGPVNWLLLSEIFPIELRGRAFAIATIANWVSNLIVSSTFLNVLNSFGIAATFLMYAGICLLAVLFIFVFVPETKNRTLEQIAYQLHSGPVTQSCIKYLHSRHK
jgi:predicted MFS family arabinose efflux permease